MTGRAASTKGSASSGALQHVAHAQLGQHLDREDEGKEQDVDRPGADGVSAAVRMKASASTNLTRGSSVWIGLVSGAVGVEEVDVHG